MGGVLLEALRQGGFFFGGGGWRGGVRDSSTEKGVRSNIGLEGSEEYEGGMKRVQCRIRKGKAVGGGRFPADGVRSWGRG